MSYEIFDKFVFIILDWNFHIFGVLGFWGFGVLGYHNINIKLTFKILICALSKGVVNFKMPLFSEDVILISLVVIVVAADVSTL